jgi:hypothetical protein
MAKNSQRTATDKERPTPQPPKTPIGDDPNDRKPEAKLPGKPSDNTEGDEMAGEGSPGLTLAGGGGHA